MISLEEFDKLLGDKKEYESVLKKCINPSCDGNAKDTFCKKCIDKISILQRIKIYKKVKNL